MRKSKQPEKQIENAIMEMLLNKGVFCWKCNNVPTFDPIRKTYRSMGKYALRGVADILGCLPDGRLLAIEVKTKTGKLSLDQGFFLSKVNLLGGKSFVARSVREVEEQLGLV